MRVERMVAARTWLAAMMIPGLAVSAFGQPAPGSAQDSSRFTITAEMRQAPPATPPAGQTPPAAPQPTVSPTAPLSTGQTPPTGDEQAVIQEERTNGPERKVTLEEAVQLALENNLDVKIQRIQPAISDVAIKQARAAWLPILNGNVTRSSNERPPTGSLSGTDTTQKSDVFRGNMGIDQVLPVAGTQYSVGWDATRNAINSRFNAYNPQITSNLSFDLTQPLLRNFKTDANRTQYLVSRKNREISDVQLQQQIVSTSADVKQAYWDLVYARRNLAVLQQTLDLARQTLKDNRTRVEVGTMAPIDIVEAQAEVARNEQLVIGAAADIDQSEDALRALIFNPQSAEFWNMNLDTADDPDIPASTVGVDIEAAVTNALSKRTDLLQLRKSLEATAINMRFYRNQTLPTLNLIANYGSYGLGGLIQDVEPPPVGGETPTPSGLTTKSFNKVQSQLLGFDFPTWTLGFNVGYSIGNNVQRTQLARAQLLYDSDKLTLQNRELAAATQVRNAGRALNTNRRQVEAARVSRELFERRLEAAQKKFAVGLATSFEVLQAQRDLANARNQELQAVINYVKSRVQFETVQEIGTTNSNATGPATGNGTGNGNGGTGTGGTGTGTNQNR